MKNISLLFLLCIVSLSAFAQLGKTKAELIAQYGQEKIMKESEGRPGYTGVLFMVDSSTFLQATFKADVAVMLSYMHTDRLIDEQQYQAYISENLPGFNAKQSCALGNKTYLLDASKSYLVVENHQENTESFPIRGLIMVTDPAIISSMSGKIKEYCQ
ncbi:hypothetical protein [Cesiribacter sp. SM1]|uniref:hypothetical protein n=1 Tax=Cesiribacter sp. SM1 TaxID=2861196 RepID=UPI001CD6E4CA|nr:hypothetical protein [Cesiribacter sp. SM1]